MYVWRKMKEAVNLVLDQDLVDEVSGQYDISILPVVKKCNTNFSTFDAKDEFFDIVHSEQNFIY
jgi:hypothetical protein